MSRESALLRSNTRRLVACLIVGLMLPSCATAPPQPTAYSGGTSAEPPEYSVMAGILTVLAIPLYIPFKVAVCAASIVLAAPATAVTAVTDPEGREWERRDLTDGFAANCGPPWLPSF